MSAVLESSSAVSWELKPLGDSCLVIAGQSPPGKYYNSEGDGLPFYQGKKEFTDRFVGPPTKWTTHVTKEAEEGDVLMSVRAPVGPVNFSTEPICIGRGLAAIRAGESLNKDFLLYGLLSKQSEISGNEGAVFASINKKQIEAIPFPVPPLPEQERIVSILDEAFEGIATATAHAERNLHNARELFQSVLQSTFEQKGEDWVETTLGDVCLKFQYGSSSKSHAEGAVPVLRMGNIQDREICWDSLKYASDQDEIEKYRLQKGDVLFNRTNSPELVGKSALYDGDTPALHAGYLIRVQTDGSKLLPPYLNYYLSTPKVRDYGFSVMSSSVNQANINATKLKAYRISLPPIHEQKANVQKLDALAAETRRLEAVYQRKLEALAELKQSLLQRAFAGEL